MSNSDNFRYLNVDNPDQYTKRAAGFRPKYKSPLAKDIKPRFPLAAHVKVSDYFNL